MQSFIVSGTDTGIGKTWITLALMHCFSKAGKRVLGMKPVASGCELEQGELRNEDALLIQAAGWKGVAYETINPYAFARPVSPHAAAEEQGQLLEKAKIRENFELLSADSDLVLVEGAGGWRAPFSENLSLRELAQDLGLPVVLVVGLKLGCINHALLTEEALRADGVELLGWVANQVEADYLLVESTLSCLSRAIAAPLLGHVPYQECLQADKIASCLSVDALKA